MPISFKSIGGLQFQELGMTSAISGITLTTTLYNVTTGATLPASVVPSPLNYVIGNITSAAYTGASFQSVIGGILSLTTQSTRIVEISLQAGTTSSESLVKFGGDPSPFSFNSLMRILRGPSTLVSTAGMNFGATGSIANFVSVPPSSFSFLDLSPPSGAATYIIEVNPADVNGTVSFTNCRMMVRQI